jgi:hypothetical protein
LIKAPVDPPFTATELAAVRNSVMAEIRAANKTAQKPRRSSMPWLPPLLIAAAASIPLFMLYGPKWGANNVAGKDIKTASLTNTAPASAETQTQPQTKASAAQLEQQPEQPLLIAKAARPSQRRQYYAHAESQPEGFSHDSSITRIEFYPENPNIKIIWFINSNTSTTPTTNISGETNGQPA